MSQQRKSNASQSNKDVQTTAVEYEVPDGGYGWVVVFCAFVFISLPMGIGASFAIYYEEWLDYFHEGKVSTSLVGSVNSGCVPLLGSLGGLILTNLFDDVRLVGMVGCTIASAGFALSYVVYDIRLLAFTYGALGGFGMGLMFNCAYLSVGYYFDKNRSFATALASSGTGFGTLISRVIRQVIESYGWRGSMFILSGICLQCLTFGALIRPLYARKVPMKPVMSDVEEIISGEDEQEKPVKKTGKKLRAVDRPIKNVFSSHGADVFSTVTSASVVHRHPFASHMHISQVINQNHEVRWRRDGDEIKLNPLDREDVYFEGSTFDIAKMSQEQSSEARKLSDHFRSQITIDDMPVKLSGCAKISASLKKSFDFRIFRSLTYCLFVLAMTLHHSAFFIPYTYILSLTKEKGIPQSQSEYLIICFGMSNFINKLWIGRLMTLLHVEQLYVVMTTLILGAVAAVAATFCSEFYQFVLAAIMYGGCSPIVTIYVTNILVKYLGIEHLTNAFSIVTIIRGIGTLSGPPIAAYVINRTNSTRSAFYVGACADVLSATLFLLIFLLNRGKKDESISKPQENPPQTPNCDSNDNLKVPKVIVTVPTAEGNLDKMIHYSNEHFDNLAARDQQDHAKKMKQRLKEQQTG